MINPPRHSAGHKKERAARIERTVPARRLTVVRALAGVAAAILTILAPSAVAHVSGTARAREAGHEVAARAARTLNATDTAYLHYLHSSGSLLFEEGSASGTLPGKMRAHCSVGATVTASFTLYTSGGSINGHGTATPHGSGTYESFAGSLTVTGGSGRYAHAHGHAGLYGVFNRRTYALTIQTTGRLSY
jgi:hypothetical protein